MRTIFRHCSCGVVGVISVGAAVPRPQAGQARQTGPAASGEARREPVRRIRSRLCQDRGIVHLHQDRRQFWRRGRRVALSERRRGHIATRYHCSRLDELRTAVVDQPRHDLDYALDGSGGHAGTDRLCSAVRALEPLTPVRAAVLNSSAGRGISGIRGGWRIARTSVRDSAIAAC